jgi:hypothetical protein
VKENEVKKIIWKTKSRGSIYLDLEFHQDRSERREKKIFKDT